MKVSLRLNTLDAILQDDILPHVRSMVQEAVGNVIDKAKQDLESQLMGIGVKCGEQIRLIAREFADRSGMQIEVVVSLDKPDAGG